MSSSLLSKTTWHQQAKASVLKPQSASCPLTSLGGEMQNKKGKVGRKSRVKQSPQHSHQQLRCRSEERTHPMMDGRELNLGEVEQEQKEALLPKATLTPPQDKKNKTTIRGTSSRRREGTHPPARWYSALVCWKGPQSNRTFVYSLSRTPRSADS